jgi:thioredoxin 1
MAREITDRDWEAEVVNSQVPVLVDVYSTHCPPCRALAPVIETLASAYDGRAKVVKLNTDENTEVAGGLRVTAVPTVLVFSEGKERGRLVGLRPEAAYRKLLESAGVA